MLVMGDFSAHQRKIIDRYYDHRDEIMLNKLAEIVSELYLTATENRTRQLWDRAAKAMKQLRVPPSTLAHLLETKQPELLAKHLRNWLDEAKRNPPK